MALAPGPAAFLPGAQGLAAQGFFAPQGFAAQGFLKDPLAFGEQGLAWAEERSGVVSSNRPKKITKENPLLESLRFFIIPAPSFCFWLFFGIEDV
jgi:hypothetical protein